MNSSNPDLQTLAAMVRRIHDRQQLGELISRYGMAVDDRDFDALAAMFAGDGEFRGVCGRDAIMAFYRERTARYSTTYHYAHTWHFEFESDECASGVVNAHAELCIDGRMIHIALRYLDRYVRGPKDWMFQSRSPLFRYVLPFDELATGAGQALRVRWPGQPPQTADIPDTLQTYLDSLRTQG